jgi:D-alanyl-D-alanine carboxypeptidase
LLLRAVKSLFRERALMKAKSLGLASGLAIVIAIAAHFWISDRRGVLGFFYPVEVRVAEINNSCTEESSSFLHELLSTAMRNAGGIASQVAYLDSQRMLHHCEGGWSGPFFQSSPLNASHRFRYASTTKLITADAVLSLVRRGQIQLDSTIADVFPELAPFQDSRMQQITIEMLLQHTAGFDRESAGDPMFTLNKKPLCPYNMGALSETTLQFDPGSRYAYSNLGYCILGAVIERVTGQSYRDYVALEYHLEKYGIRFVGGPFLPDEVRYDFRFDAFYSEDYMRFFDFDAASSSAGLSGSARSLALLVRDLLDRGQPNLMSGVEMEGCDKQELRRCYVYSFYRYRHSESGKIFLVQEGYLPGSSSVVFVDEHGSILVVLGAGAVPGGLKGKKAFYDKALNILLRGIGI